MYINHAVETVTSQGINFDGLRVALDYGPWRVIPHERRGAAPFGAEVTVINDDYDGTDINVNCGSTHLAP